MLQPTAWQGRESLRKQIRREFDDFLLVPSNEDPGFPMNPMESVGPAVRLLFYPADAPSCD